MQRDKKKKKKKKKERKRHEWNTLLLAKKKKKKNSSQFISFSSVSCLSVSLSKWINKVFKIFKPYDDGKFD